MQAMLFAAGLGTRLRPLTNDRPKALVEVNGRSLLYRNLDKLLAEGFDKIVVNVHYFAEEVMAAIEAMPKYKDKVFISDERHKILETGGGLQLARTHFTETAFLTHNVDILSDLQLRKGLMDTHRQRREALATLATRERKTSRYLLFGPEDQILRGWTNLKTGEVRMARHDIPIAKLSRRAFSGIAAYSTRLFDHLPSGPPHPFSVVDAWLSTAATENIYSYPHDQGRWIDVGKMESLRQAELLFKPNS
ncbi:nucleotidyltransferase [Lewinellaceae bacterium SD302]|nr:nucleotidyltransferase [Lewinellaceae bacterium SD302]